jgi:hypothetical protein
MRPLSILFVPFLLAACASDAEFIAQAERELLGIDEQALIRCMGRPSDRTGTDAGPGLVYRAEVRRRVPIETARLDTPLSSSQEFSEYTHSCKATFTLSNGRASAVAIEGQSSLGEPSARACKPLLKRCLDN